MIWWLCCLVLSCVVVDDFLFRSPHPNTDTLAVIIWLLLGLCFVFLLCLCVCMYVCVCVCACSKILSVLGCVGVFLFAHSKIKYYTIVPGTEFVRSILWNGNCVIITGKGTGFKFRCVNLLTFLLTHYCYYSIHNGPRRSRRNPSRRMGGLP